MNSKSPALNAAHAGRITLGDLHVARLGFGAMRLTGPGVWGQPTNRGHAVATLRHCVELRVELIDTADSYGPDINEELIAEALFPYPAALVIATKGGFERSGPDAWEMNGRVSHLRKALDGSLRRLRLERIDLYQLHRIDPAVPEEEQFEFLRRAQQEGKIRHVGLSEVSVEQIERARQRFAVVSVQNRYNFVDREWDDVVNYCTRERIAFLPWSPLQAGSLVQAGLRGYARRLLRGDDRTRAIARTAKAHGATASQIALAWLLQRSGVMLPIPGTSQRRHLDENVAAADIQLSRDDVRALG